MINFGQNTCQECGKPLAGRSDKRFCDAYCRNSYNNRHKAEDELLIQSVNKKIRRNRRILKTLCPQGKSIVRRKELENLGYDYRYFSSTYHNPDGKTYFLCYDFGFAPIIEKTRHETKQKVLIISTQPYMDRPFDPWSYLKA